MRLLGTSWSRLAAIAVAMLVSTSAAQAGLTLSITGDGGVTSLDVNAPFTTGGASQTVGDPQVSMPVGYSTLNLNGYVLDYKVYSSFLNGVQTIFLDAKLTKNTSASLTGSATPSEVTGAGINIKLSGGQFNQPVGSNLFLMGTLSNVSFSTTPAVASNASVSSSTAISAPGGPNIEVGNPMTSNLSDPSNKSDIIAINGSVPTPYVLASLNTTIVGLQSSNNGASVSFVATASVAAPEPAGIAATMMGLPCMAGVVTFARRRLRRAVA